MAFIKCRHCDRMTSNLAGRCLHCGETLRAPTRPPPVPMAVTQALRCRHLRSGCHNCDHPSLTEALRQWASQSNRAPENVAVVVATVAAQLAVRLPAGRGGVARHGAAAAFGVLNPALEEWLGERTATDPEVEWVMGRYWRALRACGVDLWDMVGEWPNLRQAMRSRLLHQW